MLKTVEVRWFYKGEVADPLLNWFRKLEPAPVSFPPRVDYYFSGTVGNELGIKLRAGRFEIKRRVGVCGAYNFGSRSSGLVEEWVKWSFPVEALVSDLQADDHPPLSWIPVDKVRRVVKFQVGDSGELVGVPGSSLLSQGCDVEVTSVRVHGINWWTLGFESYGAEHDNLDLLSTVAGFLLQAVEGLPILHPQTSFGYPHWLREIGAIG